MLRGKFSGNYRSKKGNTVFVYLVSGTKTEIAAYKETSGENLRIAEDGETPLFFTTAFGGNSLNLIITRNGNIVADNSDTEKLVSVVNSTSGVLQVELAKLAAAQMMQKLTGKAPVSAPLAVVNPETAEVETLAPAAAEDLPAAAPVSAGIVSAAELEEEPAA